MGYFFLMTWPCWLLAVVIAVLVIWLIFRDWRRSRQTADRCTADLADAQARITELEAQLDLVPALKTLIAQLEESAARTGDPVPSSARTEQATDSPRVPDVTGAAAVLGFPVKPDDLAVVEGIGPKIRALLLAENIRTWRELAGTDPARITQILRAAGPRFRIHEPATWPRQAELLANGDWERFKEWTDELRAGREVTPV